MSDQIELELPELKVAYTVKPQFKPVLKLADLPADDDPNMVAPEPTADFAADVKLRGVIKPIQVNQFPDGRYFVIDGRNRIKTSRKLGLTTIPALVTFEEVITDALMASVSTHNAKRRDNPLMDLVVIEHFIPRGYAPKQIAKITGIPVAKVQAVLTLQRLLPELKDAALRGAIGVGPALEAAKLSKERQQGLLPILAEHEKLTAADVKNVKQAVSQDALAELAALPLLPTSEVERPADRFIVLNGRPSDRTWTDHGEALEFASQHGGQVFKLIPA